MKRRKIGALENEWFKVINEGGQGRNIVIKRPGQQQKK